MRVGLLVEPPSDWVARGASHWPAGSDGDSTWDGDRYTASRVHEKFTKVY